ncbi:MAG: DUF2000 domain-containing protein [Terriglobales bacterium]
MSGIHNARCVMLIDPGLPPGVRANTAALLGASLGRHVLDFIGPDIPDGGGSIHLGLFDRAITILAAPPERIRELRKAAKEAQLTVVDFTTLAQTAKTYDEYRTSLASSNDSEVSYLGIALLGDGQTVRSLTGSLALLR